MSQRGWYVVGTLLTMLALAALIGVQELYSLAAAGAAAGALSWFMALRHREELLVSRQAGALLVVRGQALTAAVAVKNRGAKTSWAFVVTVPVIAPGAEGGSIFSFSSSGLPAGQFCSADLHVPTQTRGLVSLGPAALIVSDPLGLFERTWSAPLTGRIVVHPVPRPLARAVQAADPGTVQRPAPSRGVQVGRHDDDLNLLRDFRDGDDLRLVHWPTSARRGRLVVREMEGPAAARYAVVVDCRLSAHRPTPRHAGPRDIRPQDSLELVVETAAWIVVKPPFFPGSAWPAGSTWSLTTTAGDAVSNDPALALQALALAELHPGPPRLSLDLLTGAHVILVCSATCSGADLASSMRGRSLVVSVVGLPEGGTSWPGPDAPAKVQAGSSPVPGRSPSNWAKR